MKVKHGIQSIENLKESVRELYAPKIKEEFTVDIIASEHGPSCTDIEQIGNNKEALKVRLLLNKKTAKQTTQSGSADLYRYQYPQVCQSERPSTSKMHSSKFMATPKMSVASITPSKMLGLGLLRPLENADWRYGVIDLQRFSIKGKK